MARRECRLCSGPIAADELQEHVTGDYHKSCMSTVVAEDLCIDFVQHRALCSLCAEVIAPNSVVARPGQLTIHLGCFFGHDGRRSLGAAAAMPALRELSTALCACSRGLRHLARVAKDRDAARRASLLSMEHAADLLGEGGRTITESRRLRATARRLTREARKLAEPPRALLSDVRVARATGDEVTRRRLSAVARALQRRRLATR
jgi:hypothetical protein